MQCDQCGENDAVVHVTHIHNNELKTSHLCEGCAADKGFDTAPAAASAPLTDFLAQIGKGPGTAEAVAPCPACGLTTAELKRTGRLGCPQCYAHFEPHLRALLRRLHGATQHVGKLLTSPDAEAEDRTARVGSLRLRLQRAVEAEDFEHAAALRDQIRRLETSG